MTPAEAGPFNLGDIIVRLGDQRRTRTRRRSRSSATRSPVRQRDPLAAETDVNVDRQPNATSSSTRRTATPMAITGTLTGSQGASQTLSAAVQVANCAALPFKPKLTASTQGNASKANGASLAVRVESAPRSGEHRQNQARAADHAALAPDDDPESVPATRSSKPTRLRATKARTSARRSSHTPVFKNPLDRPGLPRLARQRRVPRRRVRALQGEGITLILDGKTDIKKGITTSTLRIGPRRAGQRRSKRSCPRARTRR